MTHLRISTVYGDEGYDTYMAVPVDRRPGIRVTVDKKPIPHGEWRYADEFEGKVEIRGSIGPGGVTWVILKGHVRIHLPVPVLVKRRAAA
jgi:hypothetical protein